MSRFRLSPTSRGRAPQGPGHGAFWRRHLPSLALLAVTFVWGTTFPLSKYVLGSGVPQFVYMVARFTLATAIFLPLALRPLRRATRRDLKIASFIGLALFGAFAFFIMGLARTTAAKTSVVNGLYAVMTPFLYYFLYRSPLRPLTVAASFLACLGVVLLGGDFSAGFGWDFGVTLVLVSAFLTAVQIVGLGRFAELVDPSVLTFFQLAVPAAGFAALAAASGDWPHGAPAGAWLAIAFMAVFATLVAYWVQSWAQQFIGHTLTGVIISMEGVFGALLSVAFLGERLTPVMACGMALLVAAMLIAQVSPGADPHRPTRGAPSAG